ncbi:MAG: hypothetical protein NVS9B10_17860 [Nevskia sp.]
MSSALAVDGALALWALAIAAWDATRLRVPNALLAVVAVPAILAVALLGQGLLGIGFREGAIAALLGMLPTLAGHLIRQVGAADVRYAALLGFLAGIAGILEILLWSALVIGGLSLAAWIEGKLREKPYRKIPAALALSTGFVVLLAGRLLK